MLKNVTFVKWEYFFTSKCLHISVRRVYNHVSLVKHAYFMSIKANTTSNNEMQHLRHDCVYTTFHTTIQSYSYYSNN